MAHAREPEALTAALDRVVEAVCDIDATALGEAADPERLLLDLTRLEAGVDTFKSTIEVLMKHLVVV